MWQSSGSHPPQMSLAASDGHNILSTLQEFKIKITVVMNVRGVRKLTLSYTVHTKETKPDDISSELYASLASLLNLVSVIMKTLLFMNHFVGEHRVHSESFLPVRNSFYSPGGTFVGCGGNL